MKADNFINDWQANEDGQPNVVFVFQLTSDLLRHIFGNRLPSWLSSAPREDIHPLHKTNPHYLLDNFFKTLQYYLDNTKYIREELTQLKIRELIYILIQTDTSGNVKKLFGDLFHANEYDFQEVIRTHLFDDLNIEDLAFLCGMSLSSFNRKFKSIFGTSPTKYIVSKRLEKAQTLLATTDLRISDIAFDVGFNDIGYFSKTFRNYYSISPSDFRKQGLDE